MDKLNFYIADLEYVEYLKKSEQTKRGFSRVPNMDYDDNHKMKFLCGIVLQVNNMNYYVPVSSYKNQKPDNFLIKSDNGKVVSSLRFNYMFPVPEAVISERCIKSEPDRAYRSLLSQELKYCIKNQGKIQKLAERTYKKVLLGKDEGLTVNSCDFLLLEQKCSEWIQNREREESLASQSKTEFKIERLEEDSYNMIDDVLNNEKPKKEKEGKVRVSIKEKLPEMKEKASEVSKKNQEISM